MNDITKNNTTICIVSEQLAGGGAERFSALLSNFFVKNNISVHHIIVIDKVEYDFSGSLLNLGENNGNKTNFISRINRFKILYKYLRENKFDYIIDTRVKNRQWQEYIIHKLVYNSKLIVLVHSYMTNLYFPKSNLIKNNIYSNCYKIIGVSNKISKKIKNDYRYKQVETIYNAIDLEYIETKINEKIAIDYKYILAVGRMNNNIKQYDILLKCYANSILPSKKIKLIIIGDGKLLTNLKQLATDLKIHDNVVFIGSVLNPFPYFKKAIYSVLTSKNEGFPTVLLESLACETPVIAFDCLSGPSEIINNRQNGILVENQNEAKMTEALNLLIEDNNLYLHCKQNAKTSVKKFSIDVIGNQWLNLLKN